MNNDPVPAIRQNNSVRPVKIGAIYISISPFHINLYAGNGRRIVRATAVIIVPVNDSKALFAAYKALGNAVRN